MIVDFDDFCIETNRLDLLFRLKDTNPKFKCTLFAIPGKGTVEFWDEVPDWCELAVHGWMHTSPMECFDWSYDRAVEMIESKPDKFVKGFKAPGWQISSGTYLALRDNGWWVADHWSREDRPEGLASFVTYEESAMGLNPDHWHGHIPNVCGNGIEETFQALLHAVFSAEEFQFVSEAVA
jgi:hypothetical protein